MDSNKILPKICSKFYCKNCDYGTRKKSSYDEHLLSAKHIKSMNSNENLPKICSEYICQNCSKKYKDNSGLWRHKKKCKQVNENTLEKEVDLTDKEIIKMLIKENSEFKNMILEVVKSVQPNNTINNTTNNNTTNNFNLQFFLNDTCKDAINLVDFIESLQVKLKDLEETARIGYTEGVSKIFINGLNELDVCKRPIHCSDAKRETLYIKDHDEWTKEDLNKSHLTKAIKTVANKNIQQIFEWQKKYPEYKDPDSKQSDRYMEMICNTMSGSSTEEQEKNMNKIIKNITKEVVIDKNV
jgi:hypothetical protein